MKSFSPLLWYNRIQPEFDFVKDEVKKKRTRSELAKRKKCGYNFFDYPLADGLLVSRTMLEKYAAKIKKINNRYKIVQYHTPGGFTDVRSYLKIQDMNLLTFADPGTWSFAHATKLPEYLEDQEELINYYNDLNFDLAGSVDWPIIDKVVRIIDGKKCMLDLPLKEKEFRRDLTIRMAEEFIKFCNRRADLKFIPFGTIQGYSTETYVDSIRRILKLGYKYIAIGGLPTYSEKAVLELLPLLWDEIKKSDTRPGMHLYGRYPSPSAVPLFEKYGVTSFDNNSSFIAVQRDSRCSYWDPEFATASEIEGPSFRSGNIKIPAATSPTIRKAKKILTDIEYNKLVELCTDTFDAFLLFVKNQDKYSKIKFIKKYKRLTRKLNGVRAVPYSDIKLKLLVQYCNDGLRYGGWKRCRCNSCKLLGPHILLVRGIDRNHHTFLHNTYIQFTRFQKELFAMKNVLAKKDIFDWSEIVEISNEKIIKRKKCNF